MGRGGGGVTNCKPRLGQQSLRELLLPCVASTRRDQQAAHQSRANSRRERNMERVRERERERERESDMDREMDIQSVSQADRGGRMPQSNGTIA
jgi:hypothetical protein